MAADGVSLEAGAARLLLLPWNAQLTSRDRWSTFAASCFEQVYGEAPNDWVIRVADEPAPRARLAVALPKGLVSAALAEGSRRRAVRLSLLEHLAQLLQREPKFDGCVIEIGRDGACLLVLVGGELLRTRVRRFDSDEALAAAVRSEWAVIAANASAAPMVAIAPGEAASGVGARIGAVLGASRIIALTAAAKQRRSWLGPRFDVDFGRDRMRTPLAAWALAVGALLACVATAAWLEPAWRLHGRLAMQQAEAVRLSHDTGLHGPAARASAALAHDAEAGTQASVLMRDLQVPWAQLFDRLEASQIPKVHLVSVQIGHGFSGLQILAEAASLDDLLAYTKQLPGGPIAAARLTHHEWQDESGPRYLLASIQADLKAIPVQ